VAASGQERSVEAGASVCTFLRGSPSTRIQGVRRQDSNRLRTPLVVVVVVVVCWLYKIRDRPRVRHVGGGAVLGVPRQRGQAGRF
jgi:hypothetical protein